MKNFKYFIEAIIIYFLFLIGKILGLNLSRKIFSFIFNKIGPIFRSNKVINNNLSKFSKNLSEDERSKIINSVWSNYGKTFVEYIFLNKFRASQTHIKIDGEEILDEILEKRKPVIFFSGHFANFELMSMEITKKGIGLATIYRPLNNFFLNPFMEFLRIKYVCKNQIKKGRIGVKEAINFLNRNNSIALMIDQRVSEGEKIKFFNQEALTTTLPAQLAIKYNLDLVPIFIERSNCDNFKMKVYKPINPKKFDNKNEISSELNKILEKMIRKNPNQWIWTHNRWK